MKASLPVEQVTCDLDELGAFEILQQEFDEDRPEELNDLLQILKNKSFWLR